MLEAGAIVVLTEEGAKEVMNRWREGHPFHRLAKFLTEHSDAQVLIKNHGYSDHYDLTITPETFNKYKDEIKKKGLALHLCNWREPWFEVAGQTRLPKPKYCVGEEVIAKQYKKYKRGKVEKIEAIWNVSSDSPCTFDSWGYKLFGLNWGFHYPIPENEITPTFKHEETEEPKTEKTTSCGDWEVYYCATKKYWFLRNERTLEDHPKHFNHPPTLEEIKATIEAEDKEETDTTSKEIKVCFRKMFSGRGSPHFRIDDIIETEFNTKGKIVEIKETQHLDGKVYVVEEEGTGERNLYHQSAIKDRKLPEHREGISELEPEVDATEKETPSPKYEVGETVILRNAFHRIEGRHKASTVQGSPYWYNLEQVTTPIHEGMLKPMLEQDKLPKEQPTEELPTVPCEVFVEGTRDSEDRYTPQYFVHLIPVNLTFPEHFSISRALMNTKQLIEYLESNEDYWESEVFGREDEKRREEMLKKLPPPFNKNDAYVKLTWQHPSDVSFDEAGQLLWNFYHQDYLPRELENRTVPELKVIAIIKGVSHEGNKAEIISNILKTKKTEQANPPISQVTKFSHQASLLGFMEGEMKAQAVKELKGKTETIQVEAKQLSHLPKDDLGRIYTPEYCLRLIETEPYIFDIRNWKNGITEEEVRKCYETGEWHTNRGHFNYVMKGYKAQGGTFEVLWQTFQQNKEKHWRQFITWATNEIRNFKELKQQHPQDEYYGSQIQSDYEIIKTYSQLLGETPPSLEEIN